MRRSIQPLVFGLTLSAATLAVGTTVVLFTYDGDDPPQGSQLTNDLAVHSAVYFYGIEHASWDGVAALVSELAETTGQQIVLTTPAGDVIADSAELLGTPGGERSSTPTANVDAADAPDPVATPTPNVATGGPDGPRLSFYLWQPTEEERQARQAMIEQAAACLRAARPSGSDGQPWSRRLRADPAGAETVTTTGTPPPAAEECSPAELWEPTQAGRELNARIVAETTACLDEAGLAYELAADARGVTDVRPADGTPARQGWAECVDTATVEAKRPVVAPPADLYIGTDGTWVHPLLKDGPLRAGAAALAAATVVTVPVGRRLTRRLRTLTAAAIESHDRRRTAMISDVAHELRTPLSNVRCHLEAARDGVEPLAASTVTSLITESEHLERLVTDLQDLALAEAGQLQLHREDRDLTDVVRRVVAGHQAAAATLGVRLAARTTERVVAHVDSTRIRQVLDNLLANALRHTPDGGSVTVTAGSTDRSAVLTVEDTGSGIGPRDLQSVFDRTYRADPAVGTHRGAGLGLAIARHLIEAHDGRIEVTSKVGVGSTFVIRLPLASEPDEDPIRA